METTTNQAEMSTNQDEELFVQESHLKAQRELLALELSLVGGGIVDLAWF